MVGIASKDNAPPIYVEYLRKTHFLISCCQNVLLGSLQLLTGKNQGEVLVARTKAGTIPISSNTSFLPCSAVKAICLSLFCSQDEALIHPEKKILQRFQARSVVFSIFR